MEFVPRVQIDRICDRYRVISAQTDNPKKGRKTSSDSNRPFIFRAMTDFQVARETTFCSVALFSVKKRGTRPDGTQVGGRLFVVSHLPLCVPHVMPAEYTNDHKRREKSSGENGSAPSMTPCVKKCVAYKRATPERLYMLMVSDLTICVHAFYEVVPHKGLIYRQTRSSSGSASLRFD